MAHRPHRWRKVFECVGSTVLAREPDRHNRNAAAASILAGVHPFASERMRNLDAERFRLEIHPHAAAVGIARGRHIDRPRCVVAPERNQVAGLGLVVIRATCSNAIRSKGGNFLARFAARRSIPAQAFALKKYRRGTSPVSKMSDNEDATASLGHSEELSVQHSPGATIPEFRQRPDDGAKVPPAVRGQDTGDVFPDDPPRPQSASKPAKLDGQVATRILQAATSSGEGEGLAGSSSGQNVDWTAASFDRREVAKVGNVRVAVRQQRGAKRIDLGKPCRPEAQRLPGHGHRLNARTHAAVSQRNPSWRLAKWLQGGVTT